MINPGSLSILLVLVAAPGGHVSGMPLAADITLSSPNRRVAVHFSLKANPLPYPKGVRPYYWVTFNGRRLLRDSSLGLHIEGTVPLAENLAIIETRRDSVTESYVPVHGPRRPIQNRCEQLTIQLKENGRLGRRVDLLFRAYDEGAAFRYSLPGQPEMSRVILQSERTTFALPPGSNAWAMSLGTFARATTKGNTSSCSFGKHGLLRSWVCLCSFAPRMEIGLAFWKPTSETIRACTSQASLDFPKFWPAAFRLCLATHGVWQDWKRPLLRRGECCFSAIIPAH